MLAIAAVAEASLSYLGGREGECYHVKKKIRTQKNCSLNEPISLMLPSVRVGEKLAGLILGEVKKQIKPNFQTLLSCHPTLMGPKALNIALMSSSLIS